MLLVPLYMFDALGDERVLRDRLELLKFLWSGVGAELNARIRTVAAPSCRVGGRHASANLCLFAV